MEPLQKLGNRKRFEVFKRDRFTCQYCGRRPPEVVLEIDHIKPISGGGWNEETNLVTSCKGCNSGKGAILLDRLAVPVPRLEDVQERVERVEQLRAYQEAIMEEREAMADCEDAILLRWAKLDGTDDIGDGQFSYPHRLKTSLGMFMKRLSLEELLDAVDVTFAAEPRNKLKYFFGVCWGKIKQKKEKSCT